MSINYNITSLDDVIGFLYDEYVTPLWRGEVVPGVSTSEEASEDRARAFHAQFERVSALVLGVRSEYDKQARNQNVAVLPTFRKTVHRETASDMSKREVPTY